MTFDSYIQIRLPEDLSNAVKQAAAEHYLPTSSYIRQALAEQVKRDGVAVNGRDHERGKETS